MSGKCGPTLVAVAAPDNWTFLEKLRPDEQVVDFFHAHLGEVADHAVATDWYDKYRVTLRDAGVDKVGTTSATRRRRKRRPRFLSASSGSSAGTGAACATQASRPGATAPASSANKVLVNQRMKRARWSVDGGRNVLTFRAMSGRAAWQVMTGRCERQPERRLTAEIPHLTNKTGRSKQDFYKNRSAPLHGVSPFVRLPSGALCLPREKREPEGSRYSSSFRVNVNRCTDLRPISGGARPLARGKRRFTRSSGSREREPLERRIATMLGIFRDSLAPPSPLGVPHLAGAKP